MTTLTPEDRAQLRDLAAKTTPGPWEAEYSEEQGNCVLPPDARSTREAVAVTRLYHQQADANFIAATRTTVPALLDALDEAEVARELLWEAGESTAQEAVEWRQKALNAEAERDRLHSWAGLMELLDEHYPESIFPTMGECEERDSGPRIISLIRHLDQARATIQRDEARARFAHAVAAVTPCSCSAQRARADRAEAAVERVREWAQKESDFYNPAGDTVLALLDGDA